MYNHIFPTMALCMALMPIPAGADEDENENNPMLQLNCQGSLQCSGAAVFHKETIEDAVNVRLDFVKRKLEHYLIDQLNRKAFPQDVSNPAFTIASIKSADISADEDIVSVKAEFVTTGDLEGTQIVTMRLKNGSNDNILFPVKKGSLNFQLSGTYRHIFPASLIPSALLGSARHDTRNWSPTF